MTDYMREAAILMRSVNYMGFDYRKMAIAMTYEHRTLQQNFMRLMTHFIDEEAKNYDKGNFDDRNEATCKLCKKFQEILEQEGAYLPYI